MPSDSTSHTPRNGAFISYARSDGEEFATLLRERLEKEKIPLWQDRVGLKGGDDWWLQIEEALKQVEFMVLVMTPSALKSDTVRKEWRHARQQGVCVYPIKGVPNLEFELLPRWMRSVHFYDLGTVQDRLEGPEWQKFVNDLKTRCQTRRVPFMADRPEDFVERPGELGTLLKLLIDEQREEPVAITAALIGFGGYGKTTLAQALCHKDQIQDAFDDGILWVTLGKNPGDLTGRVNDLIATLSDKEPSFTTLDAAVNRLKELLADRDILIVIDDVWDRSHLNPFVQGGPRCARLITTRNFDTLPAGAERVHVESMQPDEAIKLLAVGLDENGLRDDLTDLATRLGEWPLLLRLVNGALYKFIKNDKRSPRGAITLINTALEKRGPTFFDSHVSDARDQAVARTIEVSLDRLTTEERERYGELAVFPQDVQIPLATLEKLWCRTGGFQQFETEELCSRLNGFCLLGSYDADKRLIRLHGVVREFLINQQREKLPSIHVQLLDAHRSPDSSSWAKMQPDEVYLWDHLAHHLVEAGLGNELVATVKDWRYLVSKTHMRKSLMAEADLLAGEKVAANDDALRLLRRNFVNSGHLLNRCEKRDDVEVTLFTRLQYLDDLKQLTMDLERHLKRPAIVPINKLPDLPHPALVRTLSGHTDWVKSCAISADGTTIVSASDDLTLKVWNGRTGVERFTLSGHTGGVRGCVVSADGATIVSASYDQTVKVWDGRTGAERFTLNGHSSAVNDCAVSADGATIVSASYDETLKVWDGRTGVERFTLRGHADVVNGCAVSADGMTIVSASDDQTLKVWDGRTGAERFTLSGHADVVNSCAMSTDGATIVSASGDQTLKVWDGLAGLERYTLIGHVGEVNGCAMSADGATIVSASADQMLKVWDGRSGIERYTLIGHANWVDGCAVTADGATIISASGDQTLKVWDGLTMMECPTPSGHEGGVRSCAVSGDKTTIVTASAADKTIVSTSADNETLKVWDGSTGTERYTLSGHAGRVNGCAVSADGATIVSASADKTLKVWDGRTGLERFTLSGHTGGVSSCAVSANGETIVSASDDETLKVWDGVKGVERFTLRGHTDWVNTCSLSADGGTIISVSDDGILKVWDGRTGAERYTLSSAIWVRGCALSADGGTIVSASDDGMLKVWDGLSGAERFALSGHAAGIRGCAVSADGATIVSASDDKTLRVWDGFTGECLARLHVDGTLNGCACSADGELMVAVGPRGIYFLRLVR